MHSIKPRIVLSRCFCEAVRYDGNQIYNPFVEKLKKYTQIITVCPEVDSGLPVPRERIFLVKNKDYRLYYRGKDITESLQRFSESFLTDIKDIDGFLLKSKSPSCGVTGAKTYINPDGTGFIGRRQGLFAKNVKERFPYLPIEDELRLENIYIRFSFLSRIFLYAYYREVKNRNDFLLQYREILELFNKKGLKDFEKKPDIHSLRRILMRNLPESKIKKVCPNFKSCPKLLVFPQELIYTEK
ncbi:DUF523 domain-containing protein [Persephonella sp.]